MRLAASTSSPDLMVLAAITFPGQGDSMLNAAGLFRHELLKRGAEVETLAGNTEETDGATVDYLLCNRAQYVAALDLQMLADGFGHEAHKRIVQGLKKRRGRVPVLVACEQCFRGILSVPGEVSS